MGTVKGSARAATGKPVQRVVVNTVLVACGAVALLCLAAIASLLFFQNFVPDQFVTTPVYLQYGSGSHPYGIAPLPVSQLKSKQDYHVSVTLTLPRSPANLDRGNFMINLYLLANTPTTDPLESPAARVLERRDVLFHSRRPALIPYVDPVVSLASRLLFVLYHMLFPSAQTCTMVIPLAEHVLFARDAAIPAAAWVEVEAGQDIHIYGAELTMTAQFRGLRWLMFHYRLPTFLTFTSLFWVCAFIFMGVAWSTMGSSVGRPRDDRDEGKRGQLEDGEEEEEESEQAEEEEEQQQQRGLSEDEQSLSPDERRPGAKKEEGEEEERSLADIPMIGAEADDEDEEGNHVGRPSGTGVSYGERRGGSLRRRLSRSSLE